MSNETTVKVNIDVDNSPLEDLSELLETLVTNGEELGETLSSSLSDVNSSVEELNTTLQDVNESAENVDDTLTNMDSTAIEEINESASEAVTSLNDLSNASEDATLSLQDASNAAQELSDNLSNVDGSSLSDAANAAEDLSSSASGASEEIDNMSNSSGTFSESTNNWMSMATGINGVASRVGSLNGQFMALNDVVSTVSVNTGYSTDKVRELATSYSEVGTSASDAAIYLQRFQNAGLEPSSAEMDKAMQEAHQLQTAFRLTGTEADSLMGALKRAGIGADNLGSSFNALGYISAETNISVDTFQSVLTTAGANMENYGVSVDVAAVALSKINGRYRTARQAGSAFNEAVKESKGDLAKLEELLELTPGTLQNASAETQKAAGVVDNLSDSYEKNQGLLGGFNEWLDDTAMSMSGYIGPIANFAQTFTSAFSGMADVIATLKAAKDGIKGLINVAKNHGVLGDLADKLKKLRGSGGSSSGDDGGILGDTSKGTGEGGGFKDGFKGAAKNVGTIAKSFVTSIAAISAAMGTIFIGMVEIAAIGWVYQQIKPQVDAGIEAIKNVGIILLPLAAAVIGLGYIIDKTGVNIDGIQDGMRDGARLIIEAMLCTAGIIASFIPCIAALAGVGAVYNAVQSQVDAGVEALKKVSLILIPIAAAIIALGVVVDKFSVNVGNVAKGMAKAAVLVVEAMILTAGVIASMIPGILVIASIGGMVDIGSVSNGVEAIKQCAVVIVPIAAVIMILGAVLGNFAVAAAPVAIGMALVAALVAEAMILTAGVIVSMIPAMLAIASIGDMIDLSSVKKGAETIKQTAIALGYVAEAVAMLTAVDMMSLADNITNAISSFLGFGDSGIETMLDKIRGFVEGFNNSQIPVLDMGKVTQLRMISTQLPVAVASIISIKSMMDNVNMVLGSGNLLSMITGGNLQDTLNQLKPQVQAVMDFANDIGNFNLSGAGVAGIANAITSLSNSINQIVATANNGVGALRSAGTRLGTALKTGFSTSIVGFNTLANSSLASLISNVNSKVGAMRSAGTNLANALVTGFKSKAHQLKTAASQEAQYAIQAVLSKKSEMRQAGYELGLSYVEGYRAGQNSGSPGDVAKAAREEAGYAIEAVLDNYSKMFRTGAGFGNSLVEGYKTASNLNKDLNIGNGQFFNNPVGSNNDKNITVNLEIGTVDSKSRVDEIVDAVTHALTWNNALAGRNIDKEAI